MPMPTAATATAVTVMRVMISFFSMFDLLDLVFVWAKKKEEMSCDIASSHKFAGDSTFCESLLFNLNTL
jgi:hypothetical protein